MAKHQMIGAMADDGEGDEMKYSSPGRGAVAHKKKKAAAKPNAKAPLGQGGRFSALKQKLSGEKGVTNPGGLAAYIGAKKYGKGKMQSMAAKGR